MQTSLSSSSPTNTRSRWLQRLLPLIVIILAGASLYWLQWSGQQGITLGYPTPTVHIGSLPTTVRSQEDTHFSASANGRDLHYYWTFTAGDSSYSSQDNGTATGQNVTYRFPAGDTYTVSVMVVDALGQKTTDTKRLEVLPTPPVASFTAKASSGFFYSNYASFNASDSKADPGTRIKTYTWDFGDGSSTEDTSYYQTSHQYSKAGTYTVKLIVTDEAGQSSQPVTQSVTVTSN